MTLLINLDKTRDPIELKTWGLTNENGDHEVWIGNQYLTMKEFCEAVKYVLENTNLTPDDPRLKLVEEIKRSKVVEGYDWVIEGRKIDTERLELGYDKER